MRRLIKTAREYYKRELREHLERFVLMADVGAPTILVPREDALQIATRETELKGMREVLGITDAELQKIYAELGPKYAVHLQYDMKLVFNDEGK